MKKIIAIICILVLIGLYLTTFILAVSNKPGTADLFKASVYATIVLPILMYIYLWIYKLIRENSRK